MVFWCFRRRFSTEAKWTVHVVRRTFLEFFEEAGATRVHSSPVMPFPQDERQLFFVNAGMYQFKGIFLGTQQSELRLATSSQKCIRSGGKHNDLALVGRDGTHHTFFEMLGNWGFCSNLSRRQSCLQAWTLLTEVFGLSGEKLFVTYFGGDEERGLKADLESRDIWRDLGVPQSRIRVGDFDSNFWQMADLGPCGPCTEIHFNVAPEEASEDLVELWNLVFIQFDAQKPNCFVQLPHLHVDTGMGLERLAAVLQGVDSNYDTDAFKPILKRLHELVGGAPYGGRFGAADVDGRDAAYRILADHARTCVAAIADGVVPSSKGGSGLVLRNFIRRFIQHAEMLQSVDSSENMVDILRKTAQTATETLADAYPEFERNLPLIQKILKRQCQKLRKFTLPAKVKEVLADAERELSAEDLFRLSKTYGARHEIADWFRRRGITVHEDFYWKPDTLDLFAKYLDGPEKATVKSQ